jgi:hypothetical protein
MDGRRTPQAVLGPIHGVWCDEAELDRLFRLRAERVFDAGGYVRYKRWRIYGERGLARRRGAVWLFGEVLSVARSSVRRTSWIAASRPAVTHGRYTRTT